MQRSEFAKLLKSAVGPKLGEWGFQQLPRDTVFVRRIGRVFHVLVFDVSRHGPRVRACIYAWLPEFLIGVPDRDSLRAVDLLMQTWVNPIYIGHYDIGKTKWWPISTPEEASTSAMQILKPFERAALPWFSIRCSRAEIAKDLIPDAPREVSEFVLGGSEFPFPSALGVIQDSEGAIEYRS